MGTLQGVTKHYVRGHQTVEVLHGVDLDLPDGDFVALMGPSGSGKTTLLNLIGGLDGPSAGRVEVAGQRLETLSSGQLARWRAANVGFIFQFYNLLPMRCARDNVELPLLLTELPARTHRARAGGPRRPRQSPSPRTLRWPGTAGGDRTRGGGRLLVCDEPTGDLDRQTADDILALLALLARLNRDHGKTIVMVTHDPKAAQYARRQVHLDKGVLAVVPLA